MTKTELINQLSMEHDHLSYHDVELALKETLEGLTNILSSGERIEVRGFGSFTMHHHKAHIGRNPKTGSTLFVPDSTPRTSNPARNCDSVLITCPDQNPLP